jgi:hypothetical protein
MSKKYAELRVPNQQGRVGDVGGYWVKRENLERCMEGWYKIIKVM